MFEVNGKEYRIKHGTFRNKISKLRKEGKVEVVCSSTQTYYTLKGYKLGKPMTPDRMGVKAYQYNDLASILQNLPMDKKSIHDIRLRIKVPRIWDLFSNSVCPTFQKFKRSHDIVIPAWNKGSYLVKVLIHKTNVVSIIIGCSLNPIPLDFNGIVDFFTLLTRIEERLNNTILNICFKNSNESSAISVPDSKSWIVTMWHFGRDGLTEYNGEKFCISIQDAQYVMTRAYSKEFGNETRIRAEKVERPNKIIADAINEKIFR